MNIPLQTREAFKLALSMMLMFWLALWMDWDLPKYGALAIVLISLGTTGASLQKGLMRLAGTTVGLIVGLVGVACFGQDRSGMLLFLCSYLTIVAYFMQGSPHIYAWYVAGFLAPLVWDHTYMKVDTAFHFATFRYLETAAGVLIYSLVSALLWPVHAGTQVEKLGRGFWGAVRGLFGEGRRRLAGEDVDVSAKPDKLAVNVKQLTMALPGAMLDTPAIRARKSVWRAFPAQAGALFAALERWRHRVEDAAHLELPVLVPGLDQALGSLEERLARLDAAWLRAWSDSPTPADAERGDGTLGLDPDPSARASLSATDREALDALLESLEALDRQSRETLDMLGVLAGPVRGVHEARGRWATAARIWWNPERLVRALLPAACLVVAYVFWIYTDPPSGPGIPNWTSLWALMVVMSHVSIGGMMVAMLGSLALVVAPVYFFVMPRLEGGFEILSLIFVFTFVFGFLGGRSPALKMGPLAMFVMMTGISNQQTYSLMALLTPGLMMLCGFSIVGIMNTLFSRRALSAERFFGAGAIALAVGLSGCMAGPDYVRPQAAVNETWISGADERVKADAPREIEWWKAFDDPMLDELIAQAYAQNLTLRAAGMRVLQAMAARGIAVGDLFPQVQELNGSFTRAKFSENPQPPGRYSNTWSGTFDAAWELDFWGRFRRNLESADAFLDADLASYDDVMVTLVSEVAATYVQIRTLQVQLRITRDNVRIQEESLRLAQSRFDAGATSKLDVLEARSALELTRALVPDQQIRLQQARYQLCFLLGMPTHDLRDRLGAGDIPAAPKTVAIGIPADLLRRRPDIRVAERQAAAESARIGVAKADLYPALYLSGSLGLRSDSSGRFFDNESWTGNITPGFSWPILNYGRIKNQVRVQDAVFQEAVLNYQNTVLAAAQEVESGLVAFVRGHEQVKHFAEAEKASRESLEVANEQYLEGSATFTRVLDAQAALLGTQQSLAQARGLVVTALIATHKALGGGWEVRQGLEIVPDDIKKEMEERTNWGDLLEPGYVERNDLLIVPRHDPTKVADPAEKKGSEQP